MGWDVWGLTRGCGSPFSHSSRWGCLSEWQAHAWPHLVYERLYFCLFNDFICDKMSTLFLIMILVYVLGDVNNIKVASLNYNLCLLLEETG